MHSDTREASDGIKWLIGAGGLAIALSAALYWSDAYYMVHAPARDRAHAAEMRELRSAQASLTGRVNDERQILPLDLDKEDVAQLDHAAESNSHE